MAATLTDAYAAAVNSPDLLPAFRAAYNGNTRAMAAALGVTQRAVERWYTSGQERRRPQPATRAKMAALTPAEGHVTGQFYFDSPGFAARPDTRQRDITFRLEPRDMAALSLALLAGNDDQAREVFFEAYGMAAPDEVLGADYALSPA